MNKENIALQVYSIKDDMRADFYGTLKKVKEMGYNGVEFAGLYGNEPLEVKRMCEEIGLIPVSAHVPFRAFVDDLEGTIACYHKVGCKHLVIPYLGAEQLPGGESFLAVMDMVKKIGEEAKKYDMVLQYHNHDSEFEKLDGKYVLDILYEEVGPDFLQTQIDTCWVNVGGENPAEYIKKYAGRIPTVHLKDFVGSKSDNMYALIGIDEDEKKDTAGKFEYRPLGKGVQNFQAIIEAAMEGGAEWLIIEQDAPSMGYTPMECAQISVAHLKSIIG